MNVKLVYVTAPGRDEAERIAGAVVTERLAACANILDGALSLYRWEGRLCRENESVMILKTCEDRTEALIRRIKELHPYECPCIVVLAADGGHLPFLEWINAETR